MNIDSIIESLSKAEGRNLVLHRGFKVNPKYKVYKEFFYRLYCCDGTMELIHNASYNINCPSEDIESIWEKQDCEYLVELFKFIKNDSCKQVSD